MTTETELPPEIEHLPCGCLLDYTCVKWNPDNKVVQCHQCGHIYDARDYTRTPSPAQPDERLSAGKIVAKAWFNNEVPKVGDMLVLSAHSNPELALADYIDGVVSLLDSQQSPAQAEWLPLLAKKLQQMASCPNGMCSHCIDLLIEARELLPQPPKGPRQ